MKNTSTIFEKFIKIFENNIITRQDTFEKYGNE